MPLYVYRCTGEAHHEHDVLEGMLDGEIEHLCPDCGERAFRKPQAVAVTWGGLKPSQGELPPNIQRSIDEAPMRREREVEHKSASMVALEEELNDYER